MTYKYRALAVAAAFLCLAMTAPALAGPGNSITVSAAISLKNAFEEMGRLFEARHGTRVIFNFGGSGDLMRQIVGGAPVDVFAPAAQQDMDEAGAQGGIDPLTRADFAGNTIVLIVPAGTKPALNSFEGLKGGDIQKIAIGNPKTVPAGRYAMEALGSLSLLPFIADKLIYTENVRQALDYVARREVDAGLVYATDAAARSKEIRIAAGAPHGSHRRIVYPIAVVKETKHDREARAFIAFVLSREGGAILRKYGFTTIN